MYIFKKGSSFIGVSRIMFDYRKSKIRRSSYEVRIQGFRKESRRLRRKTNPKLRYKHLNENQYLSAIFGNLGQDWHNIEGYGRADQLLELIRKYFHHVLNTFCNLNIQSCPYPLEMTAWPRHSLVQIFQKPENLVQKYFDWNLGLNVSFLISRLNSSQNPRIRIP